MKILVHDYAGHPFQVQLSRELAANGHEVLHAYAGGLQTPRGELQKNPGDPAGFTPLEMAMDPDYAKHKYSFRRRRSMEVAYGHTAGRVIEEGQADDILDNPLHPYSRGLIACIPALGTGADDEGRPPPTRAVGSGTRTSEAAGSARCST